MYVHNNVAVGDNGVLVYVQGIIIPLEPKQHRKWT